MSINKGIVISELIKELEALQKEFGDVEVTVINEKEMTVDFIERAVVLKGANAGHNTPAGFTCVTLFRGKDYLKL